MDLKNPKEFYLYNGIHITFPYPIMAKSFLATAFKSVLHSSTVVYLNKNALTSAISLACLETRSRNEEAVNSTQNTIYSLRVFYFLLYRRRYFFCFWIDLERVLATTGNNVCGCKLYACINTQKLYSRASIPEKRHHCQRSKNLFTWHVISIIAENKPHAHHKTHLNAIKVYNTRPSQLC